MMDATVAICTWNRARLLDQTLSRLRGLAVPPGAAWELVVVDNNCTDDTQAVLAKHKDHLPLRPVREEKQGHSHARNRAVAEARGRLLVWTDDDVLMPADWLAEYLAAAAKYPDAAFFGGPVRPWFERTPPAWVTRHLARLAPTWALMDHGPEVRPLKQAELVYGANMAFRADVLRGYPFDPALGRVKDKLTGGDECVVVERMWAAGHTGVWVGTAPVDHHIPPGRVSVGYVWEHHRCSGEVGFRGWADGTPKLLGAPRWVWRRWAEATARRLAYSLGPTDQWLAALLDQAKMKGCLDQARAEAAAGGRP